MVGTKKELVELFFYKLLLLLVIYRLITNTEHKLGADVDLLFFHVKK